MRLSAFLVSLAACGSIFYSTSPAADESDSLGIKAPEGFEVSLFAGDDLAHDIYSMTIDSHGRIVVAGAGYIKILHDDNKDGKADRATLFSSKPASGAHGMVFVGDDLICTGDNSLMKLRDKDGDGVADGEPEIWAKLKHSEHGANGVVQGPDGWMYVACGNDAGVTAAHATLPTSPVKKPEAGAILRFSPDGKNSEIFAHGFRNIYDLDFNAFGQLFTVDSDGERDHHLPWYAPTRLFDVAEGMHHGWVLQGHMRSWNRPAYFPDVAPRLCEIGRGSPTGVVVYRHTQFPKKYHGSVFSACWTLGKIYQFSEFGGFDRPLTMVNDADVFLETVGENGFAPVDLAVGPEGDMYVAVGGRGTRGSVFRIRHTAGSAAPASQPSTTADLDQVLRAPQPQAAWSKANWQPLAQKLGRAEFVNSLRDKKRSLGERLQALDVIRQMFEGLTGLEAAAALDDDLALQECIVRTFSSGEDKVYLVDLLLELIPSGPAYWHAIRRMETRADEKVKAALDRFDWDGMPTFLSDEAARNSAFLAADALRDVEIKELTLSGLWRLHTRERLTPAHFDAAATLFCDAVWTHERLSALRLMQLSLGDISAKPQASDVYAGYTLGVSEDVLQEVRTKWGKKLADQFPTFDSELNLELGRILAMLQVSDEAMLNRMSDALMKYGLDSEIERFHYLIVMSRLPGTRSLGVTRRTANSLFSVAPKSGMSRNWPLRFGETIDGLIRQDAALPQAIAQDARSGPEFWMVASRLVGNQRDEACQKLLRKFTEQYKSGEPETRWPEEVIPLIGEVRTNESALALRKGWVSLHLRDAILLALAKEPSAEDREKFIDRLSSVQPTVIDAAAKALARLNGTTDEAELTVAYAALRQNCLTLESKSTREALVELLRTWTKQEIKIEEPKEQKKLLAAYKPWFDWLEKEHPTVAKKVAGFGDATAEEWLARLKKVDWTMGEEKRGLAVFQKKACHKCHAGNSPLGPSLAGAAARFSREDLFGAILDPHKEVAPPYQTTQIATSSGKVYSGLIVYESPDGTLVQTTPDTTIRIAGDEILSMKKGRVSLMPSGLLNDASDQDLADLYSYLKTVKNVK